jgi:AraC-type DNA-binding domain-containing proteins
LKTYHFFFETSLLDNITQTFPDLAKRMAKIKENYCAVVYHREMKKRITSLLSDMKDKDDAYITVDVLRILISLSEDKNCRKISYNQNRNYDNDRLSKVKVFVDCNFIKHISIDEISRHINMNRSSFCIFFKKRTGITFTDYVNKVRLEHAIKLLNKGGKSISEVCWESGFKNLANFSRLFKKQYGIAPSKYCNKYNCRKE